MEQVYQTLQEMVLFHRKPSGVFILTDTETHNCVDFDVTFKLQDIYITHTYTLDEYCRRAARQRFTNVDSFCVSEVQDDICVNMIISAYRLNLRPDLQRQLPKKS